MITYLKKVYNKPQETLFEELKTAALSGEKRFVVTANPEILMHGDRNPAFDTLLLDERTTITPDGIGVVKMAREAGNPLRDRITGVDTVKELLSFGSEKGLSLYVYGAKPEVLDLFRSVLEKEYPGLKILGLRDGYKNQPEEVFADMIEKKPDLVFVALGVPRQELLIYQHLDSFDKGIFIGVGGSIDVLSGSKKRAPKLFIRLNCEWLYRILCEPSRLGRFYENNVKFVFRIRREIKAEKKARE